MTASTRPISDSTAFLRKAFLANAAFSALSAAVFLIGDGLVAALLDAFDALGAIHFVGLNLAVFAAFLVWLSRRDAIPSGLAWAVIAADLAWVIASWVAIAAGLTSGQGTWAVAVVADIVTLFAVLQFVGVRRAF